MSLSISVYLYKCCPFQWKTEAQVIFHNPVILCSSSKRKFVVCLFVYKETNRSYPSSNGLNRLACLW